jgi:simple sugar transport system permease protein
MNERLQRMSTSGLLADRKVTQLMGFTAITFVVFSISSFNIFFTPQNFKSMAYQVPEIAILSIAVMLSMLTGGIDLSIVGISNAAALVAAYIMTEQMNAAGELSNTWILIACLSGILVGLICGLINSFLIAILNVTPILATLATMTLFNGIAIGVTNGISVSDLPKQFIRVGNGTFFGIALD